jgi:hypothetical protein
MVQQEAAERLARLPAMSKGVSGARPERAVAWASAGVAIAALVLVAAGRRRRRKERP